MSRAPIYLALVHHPVYNKYGDIITTSITNLDIHDIARSARTFGLKKYFIVTPLSSQQEMLLRLTSFWELPAAIKFNTSRHEALKLVEHKRTLEDVVLSVKKQESSDPVIVGTTANERNRQISYSDLREKYLSNSHPLILILGTGNGLSQEVLNECDLILKPIYGADHYNHLSVRSAAAIILDRLTSEK